MFGVSSTNGAPHLYYFGNTGNTPITMNNLNNLFQGIF